MKAQKQNHAQKKDPASVILDEVSIRIGYRVSYLANFFTVPVYRVLEATENLTRPEYITLLCLSHCGSLTAQDISNMTGRPKNSVSRAVHKLVGRGLISRVAAPQDPRQAQLDLLPAGRAMLDRTLPLFVDREAGMLAPLSAEERQQFDSLLTKLVHRTDGWARE